MSEKPLSAEEQFAQFVDAWEDEKQPDTKAPEPKEELKKQSDPPIQEEKVEQPDEPFPGFNSLSEDAQKIALSKIQEATEAQKRIQELEQRYRQQQGQLAPTQRKLSEYEKQHSALLRRLDEMEKVRHQEVSKNSLESYKKFKEMYPEEAEAMEARVNPLELTNKKLQEQMQLTQQQMSEMYAEMQFQKQTATVLKEHADAYEVLRDPAFNAWKEQLDPDMQELATSNHAKDAIRILNEFKKDQLLAELLVNNQKPQDTPGRKSPKPDIEPTQRNRQSPAPQRIGNASGSVEADFAAFADAYEKDKNIFRDMLSRR